MTLHCHIIVKLPEHLWPEAFWSVLQLNASDPRLQLSFSVKKTPFSKEDFNNPYRFTTLDPGATLLVQEHVFGVCVWISFTGHSRH